MSVVGPYVFYSKENISAEGVGFMENLWFSNIKEPILNRLFFASS